MTRVIHTGDTHLGYRQYHSPERRRDFLEAFRQVARDAVEADVDAVVHAGDLFHDRRPELPDLLGTLSVLRELDEAGIPFLAIVGNHETKRDAQWLDLFASLDLATRLGAEPVVVGDVALYGLDYVPPSRREDLDYAFDPHDAEFAALVAHGLFEPFDLGEWDAEAVLDAATVDFDAMLLGDNHKPGIKRAEDGTWLTYSGSTERASADEREDRGYNLVTFEDGEVTISRRGLPTRDFVFVDVELDEGEGPARVRARVREMGLSPAAETLDEVVRASKVADANVAETVERRVTDLLEAGDETAFAPAPKPDAGVDARTGTAAERMAEQSDDGDRYDEADVEAGGEPTVEGDDESAEAGAHRETESGPERDGESGSDPEPEEGSSSEPERPPEPNGDGQTSWSDYQ